MGRTQYFYTSELVSNDQVTPMGESLQGTNSTLCLYYSNPKKQNIAETGNGLPVKWVGVMDSIAEKLEQQDCGSLKNGGFAIVCKSRAEFGQLLAGQLNTLYYAGDCDDTVVEKPVKINHS